MKAALWWHLYALVWAGIGTSWAVRGDYLNALCCALVIPIMVWRGVKSK